MSRLAKYYPQILIPKAYRDQPAQKYFTAGYFEFVDPKLFADGIIRYRSKITCKGFVWFNNSFLKDEADKVEIVYADDLNDYLQAHFSSDIETLGNIKRGVLEFWCFKILFKDETVIEVFCESQNRASNIHGNLNGELEIPF